MPVTTLEPDANLEYFSRLRRLVLSRLTRTWSSSSSCQAAVSSSFSVCCATGAVSMENYAKPNKLG
ncbi:hypothetical protein EON65_47280 [archaeon]|nr:MAG: hypothetical protein EON65_47280 [archaeon]